MVSGSEDPELNITSGLISLIPVNGMPITSEVDLTDSARAGEGDFGRMGSKVTSLPILSVGCFTLGYNDIF